MITEIISFEPQGRTSHAQLIQQAGKVVNEFHKNQDGFVDMELVSDNSGLHWQMIVHYQTMEDIEKVKNNIPKSQAINEFTGLVKTETMKVSFYDQKGEWQA